MKAIEPSTTLKHAEKHEKHIGKCEDGWIPFNSFYELIRMYEVKKEGSTNVSP